MLCNNVLRTDHSYTYSYLDRFKYYDLIRHKVYATTTKQRGGVMFILEAIPMILIYILFSYIILGGNDEK